jgi:hypothetical protein
MAEADTNFSKMFTKNYISERFQEVSTGFGVSRTGTVGSTEHWVTVPKCLHKIPKFIQNSAKVHQNKPIKRNKNILSIERKNLGLGQIFWPKD